MEALPAELTIDILSRLPVKTIIHCKRVCKKWRNLVSDSSFVNLHLSKSSTSGLILHQKDFFQGSIDPGILKWVEIEDKDDHHHLLHDDPPMSLDFITLPIFENAMISQMGSVNGLICLRQNSRRQANTYICNPVTREIIIIPQYYDRDVTVMLMGNQSYRKSVSEAEVYTLGTDQWRSLGRLPYWLDGSKFGVVLNDHCHWVVLNDEYTSENICTFDLNKETFQLFPYPPCEAIEVRYGHSHSLAVLKSCLCVSEAEDFKFTIWVMKEYGIKKSWHKEVVITEAISRGLQGPETLSVIEGLKDGTVLTSIDPFMEALPVELTIDILSRLPVKTIIHCKFVCNKWRNLVLDPSFVKLHLSRSSPTTTGFIFHHQRVFSDPGILKWMEIEDKVDHHRLHYETILDLNAVPLFRNFEISQKGSVNGLICLSQRFIEHDNAYICNPITREIMIIPHPQYPQCNNRIFNANAYGFGVSSLTGEYKVVRTFERKIPLDGNKFRLVPEAEVYTLGTRQWRNLGRIPYWIDLSKDGAILNDHCHWFLFDYKGAPPGRICTFDLNEETFQLFPSPLTQESDNLSMAILKGCLCISDGNHSQFTIWVMKEYGIKKSWHKEAVITKEALNRNREWLYWYTVSLIEGLNDGTILFMSGGLWAFYPRSRTVEEIDKFKCSKSWLAYRPSFLKLQNFESERVHMF
ncbi:hypothetical protein OSB04_015595 [Centaurea solstitialis]|uniref:F-box domain-containing protein n=1 Tax=Centaurea solstitialis TaxID=347529 RepID=A0AA38SZC9_9ASTR|nr:hypothetical protein OSB04_015595 [Centaurea solstitialis]